MEKDPTSWAIDAPAMCRDVGDFLHLVMIGGSIFSHYVEYMDDRPIVDNGSVFISEVIARSKKGGGSPRRRILTWKGTNRSRKELDAPYFRP